MRKTACLAALGIALAAILAGAPRTARAEFDPSAYVPITQAELARNSGAHVGKKYQVTDPFQFCGSDFCVQIQKTKINTKDYYCFTLGPLCMVRMYIKKDHPDAAQLQGLKKGDKVTAYGTFDYGGTGYNFMIVDRVVTEKVR